MSKLDKELILELIAEQQIMYLETRIEALDVLIPIHRAETGHYLTLERSVCINQLDAIDRRMKVKTNAKS